MNSACLLTAIDLTNSPIVLPITLELAMSARDENRLAAVILLLFKFQFPPPFTAVTTKYKHVFK
jgi:hypothetical protein